MTSPITEPANVARIIQNNEPELTDATAAHVGKLLAKGKLTNNQIRNIFGTARQIEAKWYKHREKDIKNPARRDLILLRPKLAYQAARNENRAVTTLRLWLDEAIVATIAAENPVKEDENFKRLMEFMEAIIAYHYDEDVRLKQEQQNQNRGRR